MSAVRAVSSGATNPEVVVGPMLSVWFSRCYRSTLGHALVGAMILWAALPPMDLWPLGWIAPLWWVRLIRQTQLEGRHPYRALWLAGFAFWMAALHWLRLPHWATSFGWVALAAYLGCYLPVFVGLGRIAVHQLRVSVVLAAPILWAGLELARAHLLTGFTMGALGHTQYRWIGLIQVSDVAGAYGVDFVVMFGAACLGRMLPCAPARWTAWPLAPLALLLGVVLGYGAMRTNVLPPEPTARIALIQGSIDIELKYDPAMRDHIHEHYRQLSRQAVAEYGKVDLVVWPETMFRDTLVVFDSDSRMPDSWRRQMPRLRGYSDGDFRALLRDAAARSRLAMAALARELGSALLLGVDTQAFATDGIRFYNSAVLVREDGHLAGRYDKMHRVLFGEYVPFAERFPWLQRFTPLPISLTAGQSPAAFTVGNLRLAPNICYETVLPHVVRRQVRELADRGEEPNVLVNLTNDGWFWGSSELDMHLVCAVFRAVECRKPLLIAANTGFSAWIDPSGRILARGPRRATGTILALVGPDPRRSWYALHGDWFAGGCLGIALGIAGAGLWHRLRDRTGATRRQGA